MNEKAVMRDRFQAAGYLLTIKDPSLSRLSICAGLVAAAIKLAIFGEVQIVFRTAAEVSRDHEA